MVVIIVTWSNSARHLGTGHHQQLDNCHCDFAGDLTGLREVWGSVASRASSGGGYSRHALARTAWDIWPIDQHADPFIGSHRRGPMVQLSRCIGTFAGSKRLTMVQRELLNLHIKLYNTIRKLDWWINQHPARLAEKSREVTLLLEQLKPCFQAQAKQSIAEGFLTTRIFDWPSNAEQQQCRPVLMPLIDLLNHHNQGARYRITNGAMQIQAKQAGGSECFAHYGHRRDVLDLALHYGHCDLSTPFAHCAPLTTAVDGLGYIRIETQRQGAPMHAFDPPRVTLEHDGVRLSHLCCHRYHPERVQTMLSLALQAHLKHRGFTAASALKMVSSGLEAIGEANMLLLKQLAAAALASSRPAAPTLAAAAQHQGAIIKAVLHK